MTQEFEAYNKIGDKIDNTKQDLLDRIIKLNEECLKKTDLKSELEHYTTKHKVLIWGAILSVAICSAYWLLTPVVIKSEIIKLETKIDEILSIIKSKNQR